MLECQHERSEWRTSKVTARCDLRRLRRRRRRWGAEGAFRTLHSRAYLPFTHLLRETGPQVSRQDGGEKIVCGLSAERTTAFRAQTNAQGGSEPAPCGTEGGGGRRAGLLCAVVRRAASSFGHRRASEQRKGAASRAPAELAMAEDSAELDLKKNLDIIQSIIDVSAVKLEGLRTQCATSAELTQQEIRTLEVMSTLRIVFQPNARAAFLCQG